MDGSDLAELLGLRHDVLRALVERPRPRHELVDALPGSKSTVYKGLTQLEEAGLVERTGAASEFAPTLFGVVALARYEELAATAEYGDLLAGLPGDTVDPAALVGATVVRPDDADTERHLDAIWDLLSEAERARGVAPVVSPGYVERFLAILDEGLQAELVLPSAVVAGLRADHADALVAVAERATLYETAETVPFGVVVTDGTAGAPTRMAIELRDGPLLTALVTNDTPGAQVWATATFERYRGGAVPVDGSE
jgi:predicted transcriptional regulator